MTIYSMRVPIYKPQNMSLARVMLCAVLEDLFLCYRSSIT